MITGTKLGKMQRRVRSVRMAFSVCMPVVYFWQQTDLTSLFGNSAVQHSCSDSFGICPADLARDAHKSLCPTGKHRAYRPSAATIATVWDLLAASAVAMKASHSGSDMKLCTANMGGSECSSLKPGWSRFTGTYSCRKRSASCSFSGPACQKGEVCVYSVLAAKMLTEKGSEDVVAGKLLSSRLSWLACQAKKRELPKIYRYALCRIGTSNCAQLQ